MFNIFILMYELARMGILGAKNNIFFSPNGEKAVSYLQSLGPIFIKFGQLLSTRTDILDEGTAKDLQRLTDQCKPFNTLKLKKIIENELGDSVENIFEHFNDEPLAAASLAQVHEATLRNGESVVVKVLRPNIHRDVKRNLRVLRAVAKIVDATYKESNRLKPLEVVKNYESTILRELDLRLEASNTSRTRKNFLDSDELYIPEIYWELTTSNVMVVEKIDGIPCTDIKQIEDHGIDKKLLAENGVMIFLNQVFRDNFFHADMHPGNIFVLTDGKIVFIDYGMVGTLIEHDKIVFGKILLAMYDNDVQGLKNSILRFSKGITKEKEREFEYDVVYFLREYSKKAIGAIDGNEVMRGLNSLFYDYKIQIPTNLLLLIKALIIIEGVGLQLDPKYDIIQNIGPYVKRLILKNYNPVKLRHELLDSLEDTTNLLAD